jgi:DNA invertase Pin-like site-specific DNA recombinase
MEKVRKCVINARVSTREQKEGYSLDVQTDELRNYAHVNRMIIGKEFVYVESASKQGRTHFEEMIAYVLANPDITDILAEKTDRILRNLNDFTLIQDLARSRGVNIHLLKEGQIVSKETKSQDWLVQAFFALMATHYTMNLAEESMKGVLQKAKSGQYPGHAPYGYEHDRTNHTINIHKVNGEIVRKLFVIVLKDRCNVEEARKRLHKQTGVLLKKNTAHNVLASRFYIGYFSWNGVEYTGVHPHLIDDATFYRVQAILACGSKNKACVHNFAFKEALSCAQCECAITAEKHKDHNIYYHCTGGRGRHPMRYFTEEEISDFLGEIISGIKLSKELAIALADMVGDQTDTADARRQNDISMLKQRIAVLDTRMSKAYDDKMDGIIDEGIWKIRTEEWDLQKKALQEVLSQKQSLITQNDNLTPERFLDIAARIREIYNRADNFERAQVISFILEKCPINDEFAYPSFRQPFGDLFDKTASECYPLPAPKSAKKHSRRMKCNPSNSSARDRREKN